MLGETPSSLGQSWRHLDILARLARFTVIAKNYKMQNFKNKFCIAKIKLNIATFKKKDKGNKGIKKLKKKQTTKIGSKNNGARKRDV